MEMLKLNFIFILHLTHIILINSCFVSNNYNTKNPQHSFKKQPKYSMKRSKVFKQVNDHTTELYDRVTKIETEILDKIAVLKKQKSKNLFVCEHLSLEPNCQQFDPKIDYYDLFWKTFLLNEVKKSKVEDFTLECENMADNIKWIEKKFNKYHKLVSYRLNSTNASLPGSKCNQKYMCKVSGCGKTYQSLGALDLHHKIKHQSQRQDSSESSIVKNMNCNLPLKK